MSNEGIELEVYGYQNPLVMLGTIRDATAPQVLEELANIGGGSFSIHGRSKDYTNHPEWFKSRNVIKHRVNGKVIGGWLIGSTNAVTLDQTASVEGYEIAGEGLKCWLDDARIEPYGGFKTSSGDTRSFSFASEAGAWYKPAEWITPINQARVLGHKWQYGPDKWPANATGAYWVWGTANSNPGPAALGNNYYRITVPITAATEGAYNFYLAVDDNYAVYLDGTEVARYDELLDGWKETKKISLDLGVGTHVIGIRATNNRGAAGLVAALFRVKDRVAPASVGTVSIPIGTTPNLVSNGHGLSSGTKVYFTTTGTLPAGLSPNKDYWVTQPTANTFKVSNSKGGPSINTSGTQSGTHTVVRSEIAETETLVTYSGMSPTTVNALLVAANNTVNTRQSYYNSLPAGDTKGNNTQKKQAAAKAKALAALNLAKQERDKLQTEYNVAVAAQSAGIDWKVLPYPAKAPGWTPGEILITLLNEAKARNVRMANVITPNFTSTLDSNGQPWGEPLEWSFTIGNDTILSAVSKMEELACDVWIDADTYQLNVVNKRGLDRSNYLTGSGGEVISPVIFRAGKNLRRTAIQLRGKMKNSLAIKGETGWFSTPEQDAASVAEYGALESVLDTNASASVSKTLASMIFLQRATEEEGASYDIYLPPKGKTPFVDFNVGDWVLAPNKQNLLVKRRIMSISTAANSVGMPIYTIEFDTIFRDNEDRINRVLDKLGGGGVSSSFSNAGGVGAISPSRPETLPGNNGSTAVPLEPLAPTDLEAMSIGYWSPNGVKAYGQVVLNWAPVVEDTADNEIIPSEYQVWGRQTDLEDDAFAPYASSVQALATMDGFEPGTNWSFYVIAINNGVSGAASEIITVDIAGPTEPMVAPTAPTAASANGNIILTWDQKLTDGNAPPMQFRYLYAEYRTTTPVVGEWVPIGTTLNREGKQITLPNHPVGAVYEVRFVAVDGAGIKSPPSAPTPITVKGVDLGNLEQQVKDAIDAAKAAGDAAAGIANDAQTAAEVAQGLAEEANTNATSAFNNAADALEAANEAVSSVSGRITWSTADPVAADGSGKPIDAIWYKTGTNGIIGQWRWDGTNWIPAPIDNGAIFSIDALKITTGLLDAARIGAKTITAEKLLIGDINNLALDIQNSAERAVYPPPSGSIQYISDSALSPGGAAAPWMVKFLAGITGYANHWVGEQFRVDPGEKIYLSYQARRNGADYPASLNLQVLDSTGAIISNDVYVARAPASATDLQWVTYEGQATIPANGYYARPAFKKNSSAAGAGEWLLFNPVVRRTSTGQLLVDGTITGTKMVAGTITGDKVAAGTIGTSKLLVTNLTNLVEDNSFEYSTVSGVSWTLDATKATVDTVNARSGSRALKVTTNTGQFVAATQVSAFNVEEGQQYRLEAWARLDSGTVAAGGITLRMTYGSSEASTPTVTADLVATPEGTSTTYTLLSGVWEVPVGAKWARLQIISRDNTVAGKIYRVDDIGIYRMSDGKLIVDGTMTADKIASNAIVGRHIQADAIDATHLQTASVTSEAVAADAITAVHIAARAIESDHLTAGSIKTAHISSEVGEELTLENNSAIKFIVGDPVDPSNPGLIPGLQGQIDDTNSGIETMQQYYHFGPDGAVISKPGSVFATRIDNDSIDMLENGNVISYWNSGTLYVNQMIGERVTLGNHQIARLDPSIDPSSTVIRYIKTV